MEDNRPPFDFRHFALYLLCALVLGVPFAIAFPVSTDKVLLTRILNGLFFGGLLVAAWGGIALAANLGAFSLIAYSNKKVWQTIFRKRENIPEEKRVGSYFDYLQKKKKRREVREMLLAGFIPLIVSVVVSFICF